MNLCKYKDALGKLNQGGHSYRIFNIAIIDVVLTVIVGYILALIFRWSPLYTIIGFFLLGIVMHRLFCVKTTIDKVIFG